MKLLSLIIPTYNMERFLKNCLQSLIPFAKYESVEVLIINDGSSDSSPIIANAFVNQYPNLFYLHNKSNGGYGSVLNYGIRHAKGKYIKVLDSDDWFDEKEIDNYIETLQNEDCDVISTPFKMHDMTTNVTTIFDFPKDFQFGKHYSFEEGCKYCFIAMHMLTIKKSIFVDHNIMIDENTFYTDLEFAIFPVKYIKDMVGYDYNLYQYRVGNPGQSVSHEGWYKHRFDHEKVILRLIDELKEFSFGTPRFVYIESKIFEMITVHFRMYTQFSPKSKHTYKEIQVFNQKIASVSQRWRLQSEDIWINILCKSKFILLKPVQVGYMLISKLRKATSK